jgi:hypothetical protein
MPFPGYVKTQPACPMDGAACDMSAAGDIKGDNGSAQSFGPRHALQ